MNASNDLLNCIERHPADVREKILSTAIRNLHTTAKRNGAVDWSEIEFYLETAAMGFNHVIASSRER